MRCFFDADAFHNMLLVDDPRADSRQWCPVLARSGSRTRERGPLRHAGQRRGYNMMMMKITKNQTQLIHEVRLAPLR